MKEADNKSLKPIVLKTSLGFDYFDYNKIIMFKADGHNTLCYTLENVTPINILHNLAFIERKYCKGSLCRCNKSFIINLTHIEKLEIKTRKLYLKNNLDVHLSENCLKLFRRNTSNEQNPNHRNLFMKNRNNQIYNKIKFSFLLRRIIITFRGVIKRFKKLSSNLLPACLTFIIIVLICRCEDSDRFYRPNLPEKLCCVGIIDIDGTKYYLSAFPEFLDNRYSTRYISIEKSFQREYPADMSDSLRNFSFTITTHLGELFKYQNDNSIKNLLNFPLPDSLKFLTGEKCSFSAKERNTPEITAEVTVPELPSTLNLISVRKEMIALYKPMEGWPLDICDTVKSAEIKISFENDPEQKHFYALIMVSKYFTEGLPVSFSGFLNFDIRESNSQGFFAELQGLKVKSWPLTDEGIGRPSYIRYFPVMVYFIDGSRIPGNRCNITLSTKFHGPYSVWHGAWGHDTEIFSQLRIKLLSIPEELYLFERSLNTYANVKDDPFSEPVYLNGNIVGGNGIFAICRSTELDIELTPPY